ncbi:MAG: sigma-54 dependent transcriptional regulator [Victivallales bacterium]
MKANPHFSILIVDDEPVVRKMIAHSIRNYGYDNYLEVDHGDDVIACIEKNSPKVVILDLKLPGMGGEELLGMIAGKYPEIIVIIVTGSSDIATAIRCMKNGAFDFIVKPVDGSLLMAAIKRAVKMQELKLENENLARQYSADEPGHPDIFVDIITGSPLMKKLFRYCEAIAPSTYPVLVTGETGTGKELFSKAVHSLSGRKGKLVSVNVAGVDANVFADTLFGHIKGAYTGADHPRSGLVEEASGGTLYLDEIGDLSMDSQVKLLRLIQEHEYSPLGSDAKKTTDAKIVASTSQQLLNLVEEDKFRKDLYYRLVTHHINIPPLRERKDDIPMLLDFFLGRASREFGKPKPSCPQELTVLLKNYDFPGNVREFKSMVHDAVGGHISKILSLESFARHINSIETGAPSRMKTTGIVEMFAGMEKLPMSRDVTQALIDEAMRRSEGNQSMASRLIGISQQSISNRHGKAKKKPVQ